MRKHNPGALRWILNSMKPRLPSVLLLTLIYGVNSFIGVYNTGFAREIVNAAVGRDFGGVVYNGAWFLSITIIQIVTVILSRKLSFHVSARLEMSMKADLFDRMLGKEFADISVYHSGELMNRLTSDIGVISSAITSIIPNIVYFIVKIIGIFVIFIAIDWRFALVFAVAGVVVIAASSLFKPYTKKLHKEVQESDGRVRSFMQESLTSLLMIKTFDARDKVNAVSDELQQENYRAKKKRNVFSILTGSSMTILFSMAFVFGLIWGAFNIYTGAITYGVLTQIITLVGQIRIPLQGLSNIIPTYFNALASAERIMEIESLPDETVLNDEADIASLYDRMDSIEFDSVSFSYGRDEVLRSTSLSVRKGDFIVIEGISGIGKSTLMKLLLSVYRPESGAITVHTSDGILPVDKALRRMFAYVPQGNFLLSGTLRDNIAFVRPDASDDEIMHAARTSCADEFIRELPDGLDTRLTERGGGLSEGQIQRVAIARAVLSGAPIILLDESTSALDETTERRLLENLRSLSGKTCLIISHKKAAEEICNRRVTIMDKKIRES